MKIVDANIILRYLLNDTEELAEKAAEILENYEVFVPTGVIAEIVYVLEKVYKVKNDEISDTLRELIEYENLKVDDFEVIEEALKLYSKRKLDFVDTLLYAYHKVKNYEVYTFDKQLQKLLNE
ncbi:Predicted nucleic-acid-binding protein, contains PIN domain [Thermoanaerobacter uzonensis DSM 18761]|uniref:Predicted nucleic-acid-binding protein, contains PIN domain n=1 Tax=Thermoanaerobacter uzonensis DSM 18761 TaxID=1123369 RepID=A0A1M4XAD2_9THEO|nr:type II toxin-antitoxin system VapC family toxin [Thermoanaerobacter uzonensis]SHE90469.1 Predicted nucleic-acid-binding protein, contains PIN domain [Thermoanaerobacter uzonensis DSM 18761]